MALRRGNIRPVRAVVFDLFGTLVPNLEPEQYLGCVRRVAERLGAPLDPFLERWRATFRSRMDGALPDGPRMYVSILEELGVAFDDETLAAADEIRAGFLLGGLTPKSDAVACLEALRDAGFALALATDCSSGTPSLLDRTPLGSFFEVRAVSAHLRTTKPDPRMYRHVLDGLGVRGEHCVYVGDGNSRELPGAKEHGMTTVWVDNGGAQHWEHEYVPDGDHRVTDLATIPDLVRRLTHR